MASAFVVPPQAHTLTRLEGDEPLDQMGFEDDMKDVDINEGDDEDFMDEAGVPDDVSCLETSPERY